MERFSLSYPGGHTTPQDEEAVAETEKVQSDEERAAALEAASAAVIAATLHVATRHPVTPNLDTDPVLGFRTWTSGKPEFRYVGLKA